MRTGDRVVTVGVGGHLVQHHRSAPTQLRSEREAVFLDRDITGSYPCPHASLILGRAARPLEE